MSKERQRDHGTDSEGVRGSVNNTHDLLVDVKGKKNI